MANLRKTSASVFRLFPVTVTQIGDKSEKKPTIKGWQAQATCNQDQLKLWQQLLHGRMTHWGIPTGSSENILVLDVDVRGGGLETIKRFNIPETMMQQTPSGGFHCVFKYPRDGRAYENRVKFLPGLDTRGDGGFIVHYGLNQAPIADAPEWLLKEAYGTKSHEPYQTTGSVIAISPEIAQGIVTGSLEAIRQAPEGESNNVLNVESFRLGQLVASKSISYEYASEALYKAAKDRGKPDYESKATIASGLEGGAKKPILSPFPATAPVVHLDIPAAPAPPPRWTPSYLTHHDLFNISKLRKPQLFKDWLSEDIAITSADGGTGKTTLKLQEAICLALGESFLGFECKQAGKTLFITGEDTAEKLAAMIGAIVRQMGLCDGTPANNQKIQTILDSIVIKKDADLCLITRSRDGFLHPNPDAKRKLLEAIEDLPGLKLIVFDPIASFWGSESALNDMNKAVTKFMSEIVERHQVAIEMINHIGKASSSSKDLSQFAGRGGSGLPSNSRICRVLMQISAEEYKSLIGDDLTEKQSAMVCMVNKFSDGSDILYKKFVILREGYLFTRKMLSKTKELEAEHNLSDAERVFMFIKQERLADKFPHEKIVIAHFMACGDPLPMARVKRAMAHLIYQGHLGEKIKLIENPDQQVRERVFVITDDEGQEV